MYVLVTIADVVQIAPSEFHKPSGKAIESFINAKYADKVIHKVGLCVGFWDLISTSEGLIGHGNGIVNVNVDFRMVVFRPFQGEILQAVIRYSDIRGLQLSMDFFHDVEIPPNLMFLGSELDPKDGIWVWKSKENESDMDFDKADMVRFRVEVEEWNDLRPQQQDAPPMDEDDANGNEEAAQERRPPYRIIGSIMHSGLGPLEWW